MQQVQRSKYNKVLQYEEKDGVIKIERKNCLVCRYHVDLREKHAYKFSIFNEEKGLWRIVRICPDCAQSDEFDITACGHQVKRLPEKEQEEDPVCELLGCKQDAAMVVREELADGSYQALIYCEECALHSHMNDACDVDLKEYNRENELFSSDYLMRKYRVYEELKRVNE